MGEEKEEEPAPEELPPTKASGAVERGVRIKRLAVKTKSDWPRLLPVLLLKNCLIMKLWRHAESEWVRSESVLPPPRRPL